MQLSVAILPLLLLMCAMLTTSDASVAMAMVSALPAVIRVLVSTIQSAKAIFVESNQANYDNQQPIFGSEDFEFSSEHSYYITADHWRAERMPQKLQNINRKVIELSEHEEQQSRMLDRWRDEMEDYYSGMENFLVAAPGIFLQQATDRIDTALRDTTSKLGLSLDQIITNKINDAAKASTNDLAETDEVKESIRQIHSTISKEIDSMVSSTMEEKFDQLEKYVDVLQNTVAKLKDDLDDMEDSLSINRIIGGSLGGVSVVVLICATVTKLFRTPGGPPTLSVSA